MIRDTNLYLHSATGTKGKVNKMAITSGFFNSLNGDRTYNAAQMSEYFKGIISDGVLANYANKMNVSAASGMNISIGTGRAFIDSRWIESTASVQLAIEASHPTLNRYDAVVVHLDHSSRDITFEIIKGTNATAPTKPAITNNETVKELCLAYVLIPAGSTSISQANITDTRADSRICGWVTGAITQLDTSDLFDQWTTAYQNYYNAMTAGFNEWFSTLTGQLSISTYVEKYEKTVSLSNGGSSQIPLDMTGYAYDPADTFLIFFNGLEAVQGTDYTLNTTTNPVRVNINMSVSSGNVVDIKVLKSKIGFYVLADNNGNVLATNNDEAISA